MHTPKESSISYLARNFFYLLPLVIIPAVWFALIPLLSVWIGGSQTPVQPNTIIALITKMADSISNPSAFVVNDFYTDIYSHFSLINPLSSWWLWLIGAVVTVFCLCCAFAAVERHMRLGVRQYGRLVSNVNDTLIPLLAYCIIAVLLYELVGLLCSAVIYILYSVAVPPAVLFAVSVVVIALFYFVIVALFTLTCLTIPSRLLDGYKLNIAISYSCQLTGKSYWKTLLHLVTLLVVSSVILFVARVLFALYQFPASIYIDTALSALFFLFWLEMIPIFCMRTYFLLTDGKRKDIKRKLF